MACTFFGAIKLLLDAGLVATLALNAAGGQRRQSKTLYEGMEFMEWRTGVEGSERTKSLRMEEVPLRLKTAHKRYANGSWKKGKKNIAIAKKRNDYFENDNDIIDMINMILNV